MPPRVLPPRHLFHFTPRALRQALERTGFTVVQTHGFSLVQDPMGWLQSTLHLLGGRNHGVYDLLRRGGRRIDATALAELALATALTPTAVALSVGEAIAQRGGTALAWAQRAPQKERR